MFLLFERAIVVPSLFFRDRGAPRSSPLPTTSFLGRGPIMIALGPPTRFIVPWTTVVPVLVQERGEGLCVVTIMRSQPS